MSDDARLVAAWEGHTILVADDVEPVRDLIAETLQRRFAGARVVTARNGDEFEARCREMCPDVVIVDWHLGVPDGLRLIMRLEEAGFRGGRILMTAYTDLPLDARGLGLVGVDALVRKPFQITRLLHLVTLLLKVTPESRARYRANGAHYVEEDAAFSDHVPRSLSAGLARYCAEGHRNTMTMKFCGECGVPLDENRAPPAGRLYDYDRADAYRQSLRDEPALAGRFKSAMECRVTSAGA